VKSFSRAEAESIFRVYLDNELTSMLNLATLYYTQYAKAKPLQRQVLRILAEFGDRTGHECRTALKS
jgi:hypothetical protein